MNEKPNRILVVDDEPNIRRTLSAVLRSCGFEVDLASNGSDALELVQEARYDVTIMDVRMPVLNGMETLQKMVDLDANHNVILMSGHGEETEKDSARELGVAAFVEKPVSVDTLLELIQRLI